MPQRKCKKMAEYILLKGHKMNIQQEFSCNYPQLIYIEHRYLENAQIGVSFLSMRPNYVGGGVKIFNIKNGSVQWKTPVRTYQSWADVKQRTR